jgi:VanZ family protein
MAMKQLRRLCQIAGFLLALYIVFATLGPLSLRPESGYPQAERFAAYFVLGALWAVGYPRRRAWIAAVVVAMSTALELGQFAVPGRDPGFPDVLAKALGGITGLVAVSVGGRILLALGGERPPSV